jgi:ParB family transcriptional regulator, chromosome partitioning protein
MPKASRDALNAKGKTDVYYFDPADVVLVEDKNSPVYDERVHYDFDEALVLSMMYAPDGKTPQGVLEILNGSRNPETGKIEINDGRQRTKACREANKRFKKQGQQPLRLPVHLKRVNDSQRMAMMITTNEHRRADTPMMRAAKAQRYINLGHDEKEVAIMLGTGEATVKSLLKLLDAPAVVRHALDAGKISVSDAYKLAREEPDDARKKLDRLLKEAPRVPGRKRSPNARKAREVMGQPEPKTAGDASVTTPKELKRAEDSVAETIAAWVEKTWNGDENWDGSPRDIPARIRAGEWRNT